MKRTMRLYRCRKKMLAFCAALPMLQATTCAFQDVGNTVLTQLALGSFNLFIGAVNSTIVTLLPEADIIQIIFGGNRQPFFPG